MIKKTIHQVNELEMSVILSCKKNTDKIEAIREVLSEAYAMDKEHISIDILYRFLWDLVFKLDMNYKDIIKDLFKNLTKGGTNESIDLEHIVNNLIVEISMLEEWKYKPTISCTF